MYLHAGNSETIRMDQIIGIFDADSATVSAVTKQYLSAAQAKKHIHFATVELPKSFIVYKVPAGGFRVCFSQLSTSALAGRTENWKRGKR